VLARLLREPLVHFLVLQMLGDVTGAIDFLRSQPHASGKVGVIGFCSSGIPPPSRDLGHHRLVGTVANPEIEAIAA
jgi:hypothetical protein